MWAVTSGATTMIVTSAIGWVNPITSIAGPNGAGGDLIGPTDVTSLDGISGIIDGDNGMFVVGVFLTDADPSGDGPERLDFTGQTDFDELAPEVGQTFFIGDGAGRKYIVPSGATRLFLGFADGYLYQGAPGWYDNNSGQLAITVEFAAE